MQPQKKAKRRGPIPLNQCKGPPQQLYQPGLKYLTIGDGDFSFTLSIIKWLQYKYPSKQVEGTYFTITSYDTKQQLMEMYKNTIGNTIEQLEKRKNYVNVRYGIDVNKLHEHQEIFIKQGYDRMIWNFPHAGFPQQQKGDHKGPGFEWEDGFQQRHIDIIAVFFKQCLKFLNNQGIAIVTHKTINPFGLWNIPKIGEDNGFKLIKQINFDIDAYPGYQNRRGAGKCGGKMFPSEDAMTYVFEKKDKGPNQFQKNEQKQNE